MYGTSANDVIEYVPYFWSTDCFTCRRSCALLSTITAIRESAILSRDTEKELDTLFVLE